MSKKRAEVACMSYGQYTNWDKESKDLPELVEITDTIEARLGVEFGYILEIRKGKGKTLQFRIEHPPFKDDEGKVRPPFEGEYFINSNPHQFYLGDCIWAPVEDKTGIWRMITYLDGQIVADRSFKLIAPVQENLEEDIQ
ncbi:DUF3859 domain-containing protein [Rapidithrix thailandica]|uniref:DUF3859 domain-containing protein n=1 Tax=Rapidithrix thailandica TaxID=413964 RepID=A0AAW9S1S7_9BACT